MSSRTLLIVAGMHRSGTSTLTQALHWLGADISQSRIEPDGWNRSGYWESWALTQALDDFLRAFDSSWFDPRRFPAQAHRTASGRRHYEAILTILKSEIGASSLFVVKDPRICRLLPLWHDLVADLDMDPVAVIPVRRPPDVAASLARRDGFTQQQGGMLWLRHLLAAEAGTRDWRRSFIDTATLFGDWRSAFEPLARCGLIEARAFGDERGARVDAAMRQSADGSSSCDAWPRPMHWFRQIYDASIRASREPLVDTKTFDAMDKVLDDLCDEPSLLITRTLSQKERTVRGSSPAGQAVKTIIRASRADPGDSSVVDTIDGAAGYQVDARTLDWALDEALVQSGFDAAIAVSCGLLELDGERIARTLVRKGWALLAKGDFAPTTRTARAALEITPDYMSAYLLLSYGLFHLGLITEMEAAIARMERIDPRSPLIREFRDYHAAEMLARQQTGRTEPDA